MRSVCKARHKGSPLSIDFFYYGHYFRFVLMIYICAFCAVTHAIYTNKICKIRELIDVSEIDIVIVLYSIVDRQSFFEAKSILGKYNQ